MGTSLLVCTRLLLSGVRCSERRKDAENCLGMGSVQQSGIGKVQELGLFIESSYQAVCLPVCLLCLCLHSPSPYWVSVVNLSWALCFLVQGHLLFLWRGHFPFRSLCLKSGISKKLFLMGHDADGIVLGPQPRAAGAGSPPATQCFS